MSDVTQINASDILVLYIKTCYYSIKHVPFFGKMHNVH